ncbi:MAG: hypothetical protein HY938_01705 [Nitrosomonadales bacterium]|nr:hypothetical protein [Nitrosomonadales bacterium]
MKIKLLFAALLGTTANAYASCGSSFCAVNTHWDTQGLVNDEGVRADLRYSYAKADTPRVGRSKLSNDPALAAAGDEVENLRTINQSLNLDLDYAFNPQFSVALGLPLVKRDHSHTIADGLGGGTVEQGDFSALGDIRVVGNYKFESGSHHSGSGVRFGLKLPTGSTTWEFQPGATGERSLQPGSGSTDAILGAYYHQDLADSPWGWFTSAQIQAASSTRDEYRPGNETSLDVGAHYAMSPALTGLLQLNAQLKERDTGLNANPHSGGKSLNLGPGLSYAVAAQTRIYGFVQLPLYQYANDDPAGSPYGQLTAPWSLSVGVSQIF